MFLKILILSLVCGISIANLVPQKTRNREDDAMEAFGNYVLLSQEIFKNLTSIMDNYQLKKNQDLREMQLTTTEELNTKLDVTQRKIEEIKKNLNTVNLMDCYLNYSELIETKRSKLISRTETCIQKTSEVIENLVNSTTAEIYELQNNMMGCYARARGQCTSDSCFDFFISNIEKARETLVYNFDLIKVNFMNKFASLRLPCLDLIEFEISVWPNYYLETIAQCAENLSRSSTKLICSF